MSLNPQTRAFLDKMHASRKKHIAEMSVAEARDMALIGAKLLGMKPQPVEYIEDKTVSGPYGVIPIRIYSPNVNANQPALIYFFGGGLTWGSIEGHDAICRALCNATNCKVIAVQYRLAPEYKFPVAPNEAYFITEWVFNHTESLNINPKRIAVSGYSAGGNLAALVAIKARDNKLPLAYQVLICPWLDLASSSPSHKRLSEGYILDARLVNWLIGHYLPDKVDAKDPKVSPLWETNLQGVAPALVITAEYDPLVDEGKLYADKLKEAGVSTIYSCYLGQIHGLLVYRGELDQEKNPVDEIGEVLRRYV